MSIANTVTKNLTTKWAAGAIVGSVAEVGLTAGITGYSSIKEGDNAAVTIGKVAVDVGINALLRGGLANALYMGATIGYDMMLDQSKRNAELMKEMKTVGSGRVGAGYFNMSNAGYTMRQRALNQIRSNGQLTEGVLGNEARNYIKSCQRNY